MTTATNKKLARTIADILAALPATRIEIAERAKLHPSTLTNVMPSMRASGQLHIGGWRPRPLGGPPMAVFYAGEGQDAPDTLPRLTTKQMRQRYEKRIQGTEKLDQRRAKHRSRRWEKKAIAKPHTWASALFINTKEGAEC